MDFLPSYRCCIAVLLSTVALESAQACMNDYKPNTAAITRSDTLLEQLTQHPIREPWTERRDRLRKLLDDGGDFRVKNDLATALAHTGEASEAVTLLEQIEAEKPGLYFTAANLGTAYELSGADAKALEWIRKGIERNPDAHDGTEWLHVRILEAKLAMAEDPKWLETHSILGDPADGKAGGSAATGNRGEKLAPEQIKAGLIYQLHERLQFVEPPDAVVGALLLDLGELVAREPAGLGGAAGVFKLAFEYLQELPSKHPLRQRAFSAKFRSMRGQRVDDPLPRIERNLIAFLGGPLLAFLFIKVKRRIERRRLASV